MSSPAMRTSPAVGGSTPASTRNDVDLPAPLRPTSATEAPAGRVRSTPSTATTVPKLTCRSWTSTTRDTGESSPRSRRSVAGSAVERVHLGGVLLHDHGPLELQRRGERAGLLRPVDRDDRELLDRLRLGHRLVGVVDRALDLGLHLGVVDCVGDGETGLAVLL